MGAPGASRNSAETHQRARSKLRKRLRAQGVAEDEIERQVQALRRKQFAFRQLARVDPERAKAIQEEREALTAQHNAEWRALEERMDDTGYRPTSVDSTLTGVARATGETAKAVRRGRTITAAQHRDRTP